MTVCIAALCEQATTVIAAADRMLTAGDIEFEPEQTKIVNLTSSIHALVAGDASLQMEIIIKVRDEVNRLVALSPNDWLKVEQVANMYVSIYTDTRRRLAEQAILSLR